ncbi:unnamed protein product, partial [Laminaria digitata]
MSDQRHQAWYPGNPEYILNPAKHTPFYQCTVQKHIPASKFKSFVPQNGSAVLKGLAGLTPDFLSGATWCCARTTPFVFFFVSPTFPSARLLTWPTERALRVASRDRSTRAMPQ